MAMTEQIIQLETAKLAKEKGFNEHVQYSYYDEILVSKSDATLAVKNFKTIDAWLKDFIKNSYPAPTQSLLQKWLRENHYIHIVITNTSEKYHWELNRCAVFDSTYNELNLPLQRVTINTAFKIEDIRCATYEHCLEVALFESLNLINIKP
jgi:hypothetical protein